MKEIMTSKINMWQVEWPSAAPVGAHLWSIMRIPTLIFMIHIVPGYGNSEEILFYENIQSLEIRENWETYPLGNHQKGICNTVIKKT